MDWMMRRLSGRRSRAMAGISVGKCCVVLESCGVKTHPTHPTPEIAMARLTQNLGLLLLGIYLILSGLISVLGLSFAGLPLLMGILALVAGILIVLRR